MIDRIGNFRGRVEGNKGVKGGIGVDWGGGVLIWEEMRGREGGV